MRKLFFPRLAAQNLKKNGRFYLPYILTVVGTSAAFYILAALANVSDLPDRTRYSYLSMFMFIGLFVVGLFSVIFLFYTNSFLMKRRSRELGLYSILGMGKGDIGRMLFFETLYTAFLGIGGGIVVGMLLQKLMTMLLSHLMGYTEGFAFHISWFGVGVTALVFGVILLLALLLNLGKVRLQNPITLLHAGQTGEKEPKTRWLLALLGLISLGAGYYIAVTARNALEALSLYFVAVFLVIIGTYCLFTAVSIAVLKLLRRNKKFYYQTRNFIGVSGMLYRMKRNAVGLANICILSTMVLVMVSGTLALYLGTEDAMDARYPTSYYVEMRYDPDEQPRFRPDVMLERLTSGVAAQGLTVTSANGYSYVGFGAGWTGTAFSTSPKAATAQLGGVEQLCIITVQDYNALTGQNETLGSNQVLVSSPKKDLGNTLCLSFDDYETGESYKTLYFDVAKRLTDFDGLSDFAVNITDVSYVIVPDEQTLNELYALQSKVYGDYASDMRWIGLIDSDGTDQQQIDCAVFLSDPENFDAAGNGAYGYKTPGTLDINRSEATDVSAVGSWEWFTISTNAEAKAEMYSINGGFFFLGIFLGILFILAMVLIMYYKQVAEGYEDRERFQIMQQVGLPKKEIRKSINSQILVVFFAPLLVAAVHVAFDFRLIVMLLTLFQLKNTSLTLICSAATLLAFAILYFIVYKLTAKIYYKLVN